MPQRPASLSVHRSYEPLRGPYGSLLAELAALQASAAETDQTSSPVLGSVASSNQPRQLAHLPGRRNAGWGLGVVNRMADPARDRRTAVGVPGPPPPETLTGAASRGLPGSVQRPIPLLLAATSPPAPTSAPTAATSCRSTPPHLPPCANCGTVTTKLCPAATPSTTPTLTASRVRTPTRGVQAWP